MPIQPNTRDFNPALPWPYINGTQWRRGQKLNDVILHQRIDKKIEALGAIARTWGQNLASLVVNVPAATAIVGSTAWGAAPIGAGVTGAWVKTDTAGGWDSSANAWRPPGAGLYLMSAAFAGNSVTFDMMVGDLNNLLDPSAFHALSYRSPQSEPIAAGQASISVAFEADDTCDLTWQITANATANGPDSCWLIIQQLGWAG